MNKMVKTAIIAVVAVGAFVGAKEAITYFRESGTDALQYAPKKYTDDQIERELKEKRSDFQGQVDSTLDKITAKQGDYNHDTKTENIAAAAQDYARDGMKQHSGEEKIRYAAGVYAGYIVRNTYGNQEYCDRYGVDITEFATAFREVDPVLMRNANKYYPSKGWEKILYDEIKTQVMPLIEQEFGEASKIGGVSGKVLCERLNSAKGAVIQQMEFKKLMPDLYQVIISAP
ncbi:MAG: hypothetical protein ACRBCK_07590 [Alphaproteobacteria bacterium]